MPRTSIIGAILVTGYLGGRGGHAVLGVLIWLSLYLRETRLHALVPLRTS
jgi:hypothetical protein